MRGNQKKHIRPYIQVDRCRYSNDRLSNSYDLVGKTIVVYIDRRDVRNAIGTVKESGEELGPLMPEYRWSKHAVSIRDRKLILRSGLAKRLQDDREDPMTEWSKEVKRDLVSSRKAKSQRKKSSKEALFLAKQPESVRNAEDLSNIPIELVRVKISAPDPFGLQDIPTVTVAHQGD